MEYTISYIFYYEKLSKSLKVHCFIYKRSNQKIRNLVRFDHFGSSTVNEVISRILNRPGQGLSLNEPISK